MEQSWTGLMTMAMDESHNPLIRVMALHAQAYCERLFYLEEVEEIRITNYSMTYSRLIELEVRSLEK